MRNTIFKPICYWISFFKYKFVFYKKNVDLTFGLAGNKSYDPPVICPPIHKILYLLQNYNTMMETTSKNIKEMAEVLLLGLEDC